MYPKFHYILPALAVLSSVFALQGAVAADAMKLPERGVSAHRGENGVFPENTVIGFQEAARLGAAQIELDVWMTKDGRLVLMHDKTVDRTTNGEGKIADLTFAEIRKLDAGIKKDGRFAGTKVPTFDEALDAIPGNIWINIHIKDNRTAVEVTKILVAKKRARQAFLACSRDAALSAKKIFPDIKICNMERRGGDVSRYIRETIEWKCDFLQLTKLGTPGEMQALKDAGVRINFFLAKNPRHFKELIEAGVDFPLVNGCGDFTGIAD